MITNAFYAVEEKNKSPQPENGNKAYGPVITIVTRKLSSPSANEGKIEISIAGTELGFLHQ